MRGAGGGTAAREGLPAEAGDREDGAVDSALEEGEAEGGPPGVRLLCGEDCFAAAGKGGGARGGVRRLSVSSIGAAEVMTSSSSSAYAVAAGRERISTTSTLGDAPFTSLRG